MKSSKDLKSYRGFVREYSRVPMSAVMDSELTSTDVRVYAVCAWLFWKQGALSLTERQASIAELAQTSQRVVRRSLKTLVRLGHLVEQGGRRNGQVATYRLTSAVFAQAAHKAPCLRCSKPTRKLSRAGWCQACHKAVDVERIRTNRFAQSA